MQSPNLDPLADIKAFLQERPNYSFTTAAIADHLRDAGWELRTDSLDTGLRLNKKGKPRSFPDIVEAACRRLWRAGEIQRARYENPDQNSKQPRRSDFRWLYSPPDELPPPVDVTGYDA
jgi:hypothetical protein